jgi:hypothetical protein
MEENEFVGLGCGLARSCCSGARLIADFLCIDPRWGWESDSMLELIWGSGTVRVDCWLFVYRSWGKRGKWWLGIRNEAEGVRGPGRSHTLWVGIPGPSLSLICCYCNRCIWFWVSPCQPVGGAWRGSRFKRGSLRPREALAIVVVFSPFIWAI